MLLRFFKQSLPHVLAAIILFAIVLWGKSFLGQNPTDYYYDFIKMPFYQVLTDFFPNKNFYKTLFCFLLILFTGFYLLQINSKHIIIKNRTYLPALIFFLILSSVQSLQRLNPAVFSAVFLMFTYDNLFSIYHKDDVLNNIFKSGFFIALASLFYAPSAIYLVPLILSILALRTFNFREIISAIIGFLTPWFFYSFYCYIIKDHWNFGIKLFMENLITHADQPWKINYTFYLFAGFFLLLFIITSIFLYNSLQNQKIIVRKYFGAFYWFNLFSVLIILFIPSLSIEIIYILAIPLTFQFAYYFSQSTKRFWPNLLFNLMLAIVLLTQFFPSDLIKW